MELGISPVVTSSMILQFLTGSKIIDINQQLKSERVLYNAVQKLAGIVMTIIQGSFFVSSGMYGTP